MPKIDYSHLDEAIVAAIKKDINTFARISNAVTGKVPSECKSHERAVDGRLQALKRKGRIAFKGVWSVVITNGAK